MSYYNVPLNEEPDRCIAGCGAQVYGGEAYCSVTCSEVAEYVHQQQAPAMDWEDQYV